MPGALEPRAAVPIYGPLRAWSDHRRAALQSDPFPARASSVSLRSQSSKQTSEPKHYAEIEAALVLFATQGESFELRRILARIDHPAATQAGELLAHGRPAGAEAVLEDALEAMAGPDNGAALEWFRPKCAPVGATLTQRLSRAPALGSWLVRRQGRGRDRQVALRRLLPNCRRWRAECGETRRGSRRAARFGPSWARWPAASGGPAAARQNRGS